MENKKKRVQNQWSKWRSKPIIGIPPEVALSFLRKTKKNRNKLVKLLAKTFGQRRRST